MNKKRFEPGDYVMIAPERRGYQEQIVSRARRFFEYACENPVKVVGYNNGGAVETECDAFKNWKLRLEEYWWDPCNDAIIEVPDKEFDCLL